MKLWAVYFFTFSLIIINRIASGATKKEAPFTRCFDFDPVLEKQISAAEEELDLTLNQNDETEKIQRPKHLPKFYFHSNQMTVSAADIELSESFFKRKIKTSLESGTMQVNIGPGEVSLTGKSTFTRTLTGDRRSSAEADFRLTVKGMNCSGPGAMSLSSRNLLWIDLSCRHNSVTLKVNYFHIRKAPPFIVDTYRHFLHNQFSKDLVEKAYQAITSALESTSLARINSKLSQNLKNSTVFTNAKYMSRLEEGVSEANDLVDGFLETVASVVKENLNDSIDIPDIEEGFHRRVGRKLRLTVGGGFKASDGIARGISTVKRKGDSRLSRDASTGLVNFIGNLRLSNLRLKYSRYQVELLGFGPRGSLTATVEPLGVFLHLTLNLSDLRIDLQRYRVRNVRNIKVTITGLGEALNSLVSLISSWVAAVFSNQIIGIVQERYSDQIKKAVSSYSLYDIMDKS